MIAALIHLLIVALVLAIVWWVVKILAASFGAPAVVLQLAGAVLALVFVLYLWQTFGGGLPRGP